MRACALAHVPRRQLNQRFEELEALRSRKPVFNRIKDVRVYTPAACTLWRTCGLAPVTAGWGERQHVAGAPKRTGVTHTPVSAVAAKPGLSAAAPRLYCIA